MFDLTNTPRGDIHNENKNVIIIHMNTKFIKARTRQRPLEGFIRNMGF